MKNKKLLQYLISLVVIVFCFGAVIIFWDGYYLPNKPCRPISYPDGDKLNEEGEIRRFETQDSVDEVLQFYDQRLDAILLKGPDDVENWLLDRWVRLKLEENSYMYQCLATDINRITQEEGCIYIKEISDGSEVEIIFHRFEEAAFDCNDPIIRP